MVDGQGGWETKRPTTTTVTSSTSEEVGVCVRVLTGSVVWVCADEKKDGSLWSLVWDCLMAKGEGRKEGE